jgi:plasmid stability protein
MAMTITLKNIPDDIYSSLKVAAEAHHRSLNSEVMACLERVLLPTRVSNEAHLAMAAQIREELKGKKFDIAEIEAAINEGRP